MSTTHSDEVHYRAYSVLGTESDVGLHFDLLKHQQKQQAKKPLRFRMTETRKCSAKGRSAETFPYALAK
jgi:hypothetical protein